MSTIHLATHLDLEAEIPAIDEERAVRLKEKLIQFVIEEGLSFNQARGIFNWTILELSNRPIIT